MKKILALVLMFTLSLSLCACGKKSEFDGSANDIPNLPVSSKSQEKYYSAKELKDFLTIVEITIDNWEDYFEIKEIVTMKKDPLGEETGYKEMDWHIALKDGWSINETVTFKFTYNESNKMVFTN